MEEKCKFAIEPNFVFGKAVEREGEAIPGGRDRRPRFDRRLGFSDWSLHDFRRAMSTRLHEAGVQPHIVEALLAHRHKAGVAGPTTRRTTGQKREALELWAEMIEKIVGA